MSLPHPPRFGASLDLGGEGRSSRELFAGVTLAALALPLNIGYATAAGFPVTVGIYATLLPLVVFALTSGSRHLVVGPDATIAALLAAVVAPIVAAGADPAEVAWATALCVGASLLLFWAFRLGGLVRFVSKAVLVGFIAGLGIEVLTSQVRKIMDVDVATEGWLLEVVELVRSLPDASVGNVLVAVFTIAGLRLMARYLPRLPGALLVLATVTLVVAAFEPEGVGLLGTIPSGLPTPTFPSLDARVWLDLVAVSVAIAVLTTAEGTLIAQREARRHGEALDPNGEVFALGLSNVASAVSGGMPIGASASRTSALAATGSQTQVPAVTAALCVAGVLLFFTDAVSWLPEAALAALVANAVVSTIEIGEMRRFGRLRRTELGIAAGCAAGVLLIGPLGGLVLAVMVSAIDVVRRAAAAPWAQLRPDDADPTLIRFQAAEGMAADDGGLRMVRPGGPLFFANADGIRAAIERMVDDPGVRWIVLDFETVSDIDPTAAEALSEAIELAHTRDITVALTRVLRPARDLLDRYEIVESIGTDRIYQSNRAAWAAYQTAITSGDADTTTPR